MKAINNVKKTSKLISAAAASLLLLTSCASSEAVFTYKDNSISENEFTYYLATYKARFLQSYSDFKDTSAFYSSTLGDSGMTAEEYLFDAVVHNVKMSLICDTIAEEKGITVSNSTVQVIDEYLTDFVTEYSGGSKAQFNQALSAYGVNYNMLRNIYLRDERGSALYTALYGSNGEIGITDTARSEYLNENYVRVRHIYVNNKYDYVLDDDGYVVTSSDGSYQKRTLTADEQAEKDAVVAKIDTALSNGDDFETVYTTYSEDQNYENGYYLTRDIDFVDEVVGSAFNLEIGSYVKVESDVGTHYIMRLEMDASPWNEDANSDFFPNYDTLVGQSLFTKYIEAYIDDVEVNEDILSGFSVEESPTNYRF